MGTGSRLHWGIGCRRRERVIGREMGAYDGPLTVKGLDGFGCWGCHDCCCFLL
jgi:hypothetical protein